MIDSGGQLAKHGQFGGLYQFILGTAKVLFGATALLDLLGQQPVGLHQVTGAQGNIALELVACPGQGLALTFGKQLTLTTQA